MVHERLVKKATAKFLALSEIVYLSFSLKFLSKNWMKSRKSCYGQVKNLKLNMVHCVMS